MSNEEIFNTDAPAQTATKYTAEIRGRSVFVRESFEPITLDNVKSWAREGQISNFKISTVEGAGLSSSDFPYRGNIIIREYNAAKSE